MSVNLTGVIALNPRPAQPFVSPVGLFFHLRVPTAHRGGEIFPEDHLPAISQRPRFSCESKNKRGGLLDSEGKKTQQKKNYVCTHHVELSLSNIHLFFRQIAHVEWQVVAWLAST